MRYDIGKPRERKRKMFAAIHIDKRDGYVYSVNLFNTYEGACNFIWQDMLDFLSDYHAGDDWEIRGERGDCILEAMVGNLYRWSVENAYEVGKRR